MPLPEGVRLSFGSVSGFKFLMFGKNSNRLLLCKCQGCTHVPQLLARKVKTSYRSGAWYKYDIM